jgi:hypothetical protein
MEMGHRRPRQAEIGQLRVTAVRDQDIGRLDVSVQDLRFMRNTKAICDTHQQFQDLTPRPLTGLRPITQRATVDVFGNQVLPSLPFACIVDCQNVGMVAEAI